MRPPAHKLPRPGGALFPLLAVLLGLALSLTRAAPAVVRRARPAQDAGSLSDASVDALPEAALALAPAPLSVLEDPRAQALYDRLCAPCHGAAGDGDGPLARWLRVPPRDLRAGSYKWRSTPSGSAPTEQDVAWTLARGVPGAVMPAFGQALPPAERLLLARYALALRRAPSPAGAPWEPSASLLRSLDAAPTEALVAQGGAVYARLGCASCHGEGLRGDGPAALTQPPPPYDLTRHPARGGSDARSLARSLRTGLDGTTMPAFEQEALSDEDLAALVHWLRARLPEPLRREAEPDPARWWSASSAAPAVPPPSPLRASPVVREREAHFWELPLAPQGEGPAQLTPAERSLDPAQCARCHAAQFEQFRGSLHAAAMGPGVRGQLLDLDAPTARGCQLCHGPLEEQFPLRREGASGALPGSMRAAPHGGGGDGGAPAGWQRNPDFEPELYGQGVLCAACHLRGRERFGPPAPSAARLPGVAYPSHALPRFERGDFCAPCHQLPPADAIEGRPALDTVSEWLFGGYFARGIQCQHCHMPDREHRWRGAHDPDTVRQAVSLALEVRRDGGSALARATVQNIGAGHSFPGTATPAAVLSVEWLDAQGRPLGPASTEPLQRRLRFDGARLQQVFDTRLAPGATRVLEVRTQDARARSARATLTFRPDEYYEGFYAGEVSARGRSARGRALLEEALSRTRATPFVVHQRTEALP